jgi:hypothetical protein
MIHDTLRALLVIAVLAAGCSLLVETRHRLAVIELSARLATPQPYATPAFQRFPLTTGSDSATLQPARMVPQSQHGVRNFQSPHFVGPNA